MKLIEHNLAEVYWPQATINTKRRQFWQIHQPIFPPRTVLCRNFIIPIELDTTEILENLLHGQSKRCQKIQGVKNRTCSVQYSSSKDEVLRRF